jgi:uncharacterized protein
MGGLLRYGQGDIVSDATVPKGEAALLRVLVDADACPVKDEVYSVAARYGVAVTLVANSRLHTPARLRVEMVVVDGAPDAADDWIADHAHPGDVVITADIPLAARCIAASARVLGTNGRVFSEDSIGGALATRDLKSQLRDVGIQSRGPAAISAKDRSRFLSKLDELIQRGLRER